MDILTESRCYDFICLLIIGKFDLCKIAKHLFFGKICSKKTVDTVWLKFYTGWLTDLIADINHTANNLTGTKLFHQLAGSVDCSLCIIRVKTFLKLTGSICTKSDSLGRKSDVCSIKAGCFKQNCVYVICDHGILATHNTSDSNRFLTIADHQDVLVHNTFLTIQCDKFLIFTRTAYNNFMVCNRIEIVSMHWLSKLFHYIVGDIYQIVDRADSIGSQAALHPFRRWSDLNIFYNSCTVTWAKLRFLYSYLYVIRSFFSISCLFNFRRVKFLTKSSCCFSCNSKNTITVNTVGRNLIFKYNVIKSKSLNSALTYNCIFREYINSIFRGFRIHIPVASQLFDGAHHAVGRYSAKFSGFDPDSARSHFSIMSSCYTTSVKNNRNLVSLFYVWSTSNDLDHLRSDIHLADDQLICIRMFLNFLNLSDYNLVKVSIKPGEAFYLCT